MRNLTTFCPIWLCLIKGSSRCSATCYDSDDACIRLRARERQLVPLRCIGRNVQAQHLLAKTSAAQLLDGMPETPIGHRGGP